MLNTPRGARAGSRRPIKLKGSLILVQTLIIKKSYQKLIKSSCARDRNSERPWLGGRVCRGLCTLILTLCQNCTLTFRPYDKFGSDIPTYSSVLFVPPPKPGRPPPPIAVCRVGAALWRSSRSR